MSTPDGILEQRVRIALKNKCLTLAQIAKKNKRIPEEELYAWLQENSVPKRKIKQRGSKLVRFTLRDVIEERTHLKPDTAKKVKSNTIFLKDAMLRKLDKLEIDHAYWKAESPLRTTYYTIRDGKYKGRMSALLKGEAGGLMREALLNYLSLAHHYDLPSNTDYLKAYFGYTTLVRVDNSGYLQLSNESRERVPGMTEKSTFDKIERAQARLVREIIEKKVSGVQIEEQYDTGRKVPDFAIIRNTEPLAIVELKAAVGGTPADLIGLPTLAQYLNHFNSLWLVLGGRSILFNMISQRKTCQDDCGARGALVMEMKEFREMVTDSFSNIPPRRQPPLTKIYPRDLAAAILDGTLEDMREKITQHRQHNAYYSQAGHYAKGKHTVGAQLKKLPEGRIIILPDHEFLRLLNPENTSIRACLEQNYERILAVSDMGSLEKLAKDTGAIGLFLSFETLAHKKLLQLKKAPGKPSRY